MKSGAFLLILFLLMSGCTSDYDNRRNPDTPPADPTDFIININKLIGSESGINLENQDTTTDGLLNFQLDFGIISNPGNGTIPRINKNFVLKNGTTTNQAININSLSITESSPKGFFIRYDRCSGKTLGKDQECVVSVSFLARGIYNGPKTAVFELITPTETFSFNLLTTVEGYPPPVQTGTPVLSIMSSANFGDYPTNEEVFRTITIQNTSTDLVLPENTLTTILDDPANGFYVRYNSCLTTILPNSNCKISIFFQKHRLVRFGGESLSSYQASLIIPFMNQTVDLLTGSVNGGTGSFRYPVALNKAGSLSFYDVNNSVNVNDQIYFSAKESASSSFKLYKLDNGVGKLVDSSLLDEPLILKQFQGKLYFTTYNKIYSYDGTTLTNVVSSLGVSIVSDARIHIEFDGKLYMSGNFSDRYRLLRFDGVNPPSEVQESGGIALYEASNFEENGGSLYFKARSGTAFSPFKIYLSNGSTYGQICQISSTFTNVTPFAGNKFIFYETSNDLINFAKSFRKMYTCNFNGIATEVKLGSLSLNTVKTPTIAGSEIYFAGSTNTIIGSEPALYKYNVSTATLTEITSAGSSFRFTSNILYKASVGEIYFVAAVTGPIFEPRLYRYNTTLETLNVVNSSYSNTSGQAIELIGDDLYFQEMNVNITNARQLVKYNVSSQAITVVTSIGTSFGELFVNNGELFFTSQSGGGPKGLFKINTSGTLVSFGVSLSTSFFPFVITNDGTFLAVGSSTMYKVNSSTLEEYKFPSTNTFLTFNTSNEKLYKKIINSSQGLFIYGQRYTNDLKKPYLSTGSAASATEIIPDYVPFFLSVENVFGTYDELFVISNGNLYKQNGNDLFPVSYNSNVLSVSSDFKIYSTAAGLSSFFVDNAYNLYEIPNGSGNNTATFVQTEVTDIVEYGGIIYYYAKYVDLSSNPTNSNCYTPHTIDSSGNRSNFYDMGSYCYNNGSANSFIYGKFFKTMSLGLILRELGNDNTSDCSGQLSSISSSSLSYILPYSNPLRISNLVEKNGEVFALYTNGADYIFNLNTNSSLFHNSTNNAFSSGMCVYSTGLTSINIDDNSLLYKNIGNNTAGSGYIYMNLSGNIFMGSSSTNSFALIRDPEDTFNTPSNSLNSSSANNDISYQMTFSSPAFLLMAGNSMYGNLDTAYIVSGDPSSMVINKILDIPGLNNVYVRYSGFDNQEIIGVGSVFFINYTNGPNNFDSLRYDPSSNTSSTITDPSSGLELYDFKIINQVNGTTYLAAIERGGGAGYYKIFYTTDGYTLNDTSIYFDSIKKMDNSEVTLIKGRYSSDSVSVLRTFVFYSSTYGEITFQGQGVNLLLSSLYDPKNGYEFYLSNDDSTRLFKVDATSYVASEILIPAGHQASLISASRSTDGKLVIVLPRTSGGLQVFRLDP